jgi:intergrase/recombinase
MKKDTNQTAMQELIEYIESNEIVYNKDLILKLKELLEKEKEQIIDAYNSKVNEHLFAPITSINKINGEEYYNQTYKI